MGKQLGNYIQETQWLLRDSNGLLTQPDQLKYWINRGRRQIAKLTSCMRALIPGNAPFGAAANPGAMIPGGFSPGSDPASSFNTLVGVERYSFAYANDYLRKFFTGYKSVIDLVDVSVNWSGSTRPTMSWVPWDELQAYARAYSVGVFSYPVMYSTNGDGEAAQVWLFPVPSFVCEMEWDAICIPADLNTDSDYDAIPDPFADAVKFYAAALCYYGRQQPGSANIMLDEFGRHAGLDRVASDRGKVANYYQWLMS